MEEQIFTVGIVIADKDEYVHVYKELGADAAAYAMVVFAILVLYSKLTQFVLEDNKA